MARLRTAPGAGMSVNEGGIGLPAICALIACERLGDRSFSKEVAQRASCLRPQLFEQTLTTVRTVLKEQDNLAPSRSTRSAQRPLSYDSLAKKYGANRVDPNIVKDCQRVERGLAIALDDTSGWNDRRITATVFWWCCEARGITTAPEKEYIKAHEISHNDWNLIKFQLTRCMQDEYQRLRAKASGAAKPPPPRPANVIKIRRRRASPESKGPGTTPKRKVTPLSDDTEEYGEAYDPNAQTRALSSPGPPLTPPPAGSLPPISPPTKRTGPLKYRPVYPDRSVYGLERVALRTQAAADFMAWRAANP
ncbi:ORC6 domain containing protein [Ceratobasidium theobromae]|uniref:ORC6 domain containing protein n=1 Tax=Ceratobasidium theobromae TaxID=1582974 RepID=A0A5N5QJJ6_9AGAM|nr:ORC6 domain containing protein [Ceratobasidium theobromae]